MRAFWRRATVTALTIAATGGVAVERTAAVAITEHRAGLGSGHWPAFIAPGPDGNLWFTFWSCGRGSGTCGLGRVTPAAAITEFTSGLPTDTFPTAITAGSDGNLWFVDAPEGGTTPAIRKISPSGAVTESPSAIESGNSPTGIATGPDGNVSFLSQGAAPEITRLTPGGSVTDFSAPSTVLPMDGTLRSITPGRDNALWFTDPGVTPLIGRIGTNGAITPFPLARSSFPADIVVGPDGNVWFTDQGPAPAIVRMTPSGAMTPFSAGLSSGATPDAITVGADGNLWFTEHGTRNGVGRITPNGTITEFGDGLPAGANLHDIAAGPDGNVWFTDQACNGGPDPCAVGQVALQLPPAVVTGDASAISQTGARVTGAVNPLGGLVSRVVVRYRISGGSPHTAAASPSSLPASGGEASVSATLSSLPPGRAIAYEVRATSVFGTTAGATRTFRTLAGPAPVISGLTQSHRRWRRGSHLASLSRRRPRSPLGTTFGFRLNEAAAMRLQFTLALPGRRVGHRCLPATAPRRRRPRCTRLSTAGELRFGAHSGINRVHFEGCLSARRSLRPGTHRVRLVATAFGRSAASRPLTFVVATR